ncbi:MBL fold metallo-hydrolase [Rhodococcus sp. SJ-2]
MKDSFGLPRELAPGVFWLGACNQLSYQGRLLHSYNSVYVVVGGTKSMIVEAGHPARLSVIEEQLEQLIARGVPEPSYVFLTHTETPHASGVGRLLHRFPGLVACGDIADLHLVFPQYVDRLISLDPGDSLDLGGSEFEVVEAVFRDHVTTRWGFDTRTSTLFTGDGFSYSHYHEAGQCGHLAEEVDEIDLPDMVSLFAGLAFNWTLHTDIEPYLERLDAQLFDELDVALVAPTHGLPISDPFGTMPGIRDGLRMGSRRRDVAMLSYRSSRE